MSRDFIPWHPYGGRETELNGITVNGNLKKYDPSTGKVTLISKNMPSDKNAGKYRVYDNYHEDKSVWQHFTDAIMSLLNIKK